LAVAEESGGALAGEAAVGVNAVCVGVAVVVAGEAFVDVGARNAVAFKAAIAAALETTSRVDARGVVAAVVAAFGTFVDVVAIVSAKTVFTAALEATGCVCADAVFRTARGLGAFVDVETGLSISLESVVTVAIKRSISIGTDGVGGAGANTKGALIDVLALAIVVSGSASAAAAREVAGCVDALLSKWAGCGVIALIDVDAASVIIEESSKA
jgi:hypothetical protein